MTHQNEGDILQPVDVFFSFYCGDTNSEVTHSVSSLGSSQEIACDCEEELDV